MSNSLGVIKSSTPIEAVKATQPRMISQIALKPAKQPDTIIKIVSANEISVPVNKTFFTVAHLLLFVLYEAFATIILYFGERDLTPNLYVFKTLDVSKSSFSVISYSYPITWILSLSLIISGVFNLVSVTIFRNYYMFYLSKCKSPLRWMEYFITSGLNASVIAVVLGNKDLMTVILLAFLTAVGTSFGYWTETLARPLNQLEWTLPYKTRVVPWMLGFITVSVPIIVMIVLFYLSDISTYTKTEHLHAVLWSQFVLFPSFGNVLAIQQWFRPSRYQRVELFYQVSAVLSRFTLAAIVFFSILRNKQWQDQFS